MIELFMPMDCESGGLSDEVSLLSAYFEIVDKDWNVVDTLDLYIKPNDGLYKVEAGGLEVNKINLVEHDKKAITYSEAGQLLFRFLNINSNQGKIKIVPLGKNVSGDVRWVNKHLLNKGNWERFCSYRTMDISPFARALQIQGKIPPDVGLSLFSLRDFLETKGLMPEIEGNPHEAKYDTKLTVDVFRGLLAL